MQNANLIMMFTWFVLLACMGGCMSQEFSRNDLIVNTGISCKLSSYTFHYTGNAVEYKLNHTDTFVYPTVNNIRFASSDGWCLISYDNAVFYIPSIDDLNYVEYKHDLNENILSCKVNNTVSSNYTDFLLQIFTATQIVSFFKQVDMVKNKILTNVTNELLREDEEARAFEPLISYYIDSSRNAVADILFLDVKNSNLNQKIDANITPFLDSYFSYLNAAYPEVEITDTLKIEIRQNISRAYIPYIVTDYLYSTLPYNSLFFPRDDILATTTNSDNICVLYKNKNILCYEIETNTGVFSQFLSKWQYVQKVSINATSLNTFEKLLKSQNLPFVSNGSVSLPSNISLPLTFWQVTVPADIDANVVSIQINMMSFCVLFSNGQVWCLGVVLMSDGVNLESGKISMSDLGNTYRLVAENVKRLSGHTMYEQWFRPFKTTAGSGLDVFNDCVWSSEPEPFPLWAILSIVGVLSLILTALGFWYYRRSKQSAYLFVQEVPV